MQSQLDPFFNPSSIALVGISRRKPSLGQLILENLTNSGYENPIYLINPKAEIIEGRKCIPSIDQIPDSVDMTIILTPVNFVLTSVLQSIDKGARAIIIITAGFSEVSDEGREMELQLLEAVRDKTVNIIGPNSMGIYAPGTHASFSPIPIIPGEVAYLSQSGSILVVAAENMLPFNLGFSKFISLGNKIDVHTNMALDYLITDRDTLIINAYLESFSEPEKLREDLTRVSRIKPVVMVKGGRTKAGSRAATSHTGALAGEHKLVEAVLRSSGVISADNIEEQISITRFLRSYPKIEQGGIAVVSSAGGPGIIASDQVVESGLRMAQLSQITRERLRTVVPPQGSILNPVDILAAADESLHVDVIDILMQDDDVAAIIVIVVHPVLISAESLLKYLERYTQVSKPLIISYLGPDYIEYQQMTGLVVTGSTKDAVVMLRGAMFYSVWRNNVDSITDFSHLESKGPSLSKSPKALLEEYGFEFPPEAIVRSFDEAVEFTVQFGYPVALKIEHEQFSHKSDIGGVFLNIGSDQELEKTWNQLDQIYEEAQIKKLERKVSIQPFYERGIEVAMGVVHDDMFGHFVMIGSGGIFIELYEDISFHPSPMSGYSARKMLDSLKLKHLLAGFRQYQSADVDQLLDQLLQLDNLIQNNKEIKELDINPLMILPDGRMVVIDVRMEV